MSPTRRMVISWRGVTAAPASRSGRKSAMLSMGRGKRQRNQERRDHTPPPAVVWLVRDPGVPEPGITAACPTEEAARHFVAALERQRRKLFVERWEVDAVSKLSAALGEPAEDQADGHTGADGHVAAMVNPQVTSPRAILRLRNHP